ncbi:MAG: hypothetical protein A3F54_02130 [Candidatus Kerfeldbacteria bacterium RIFCSPHIGHO2_12_FULL_48_17]|uniref:DUF2029 domain-containing protein n=1 Tax=Candidatus Kerfeldbacteria bacterium RIFCSPHIGHO2_12_FULL_48_17 TaxID=1798542 RepID=A0A1G2AWV2_9BACT|nr:MAG: hypothetical protein A3F54_02130 [Candidatus Kerfeldbacteria bacterium RIFCSPHIGHO2_12_FULL_48_17]
MKKILAEFFREQRVYKMAALLCVVAAVALFVFYTGWYQRQALQRIGYGETDYAVFYVAGTQLLHGVAGDIYNPATFIPAVKALRETNGGTRYVYFPASVFLFAPLALFSYKTGVVAWLFFNIALFVAAYYIGVWLVDPRWWRLRYSLILAALTFSDTAVGLMKRGQINGLIWLVFMLGLVFLARGGGRRGRDGRAGDDGREVSGWRVVSEVVAGAMYGVNILLKIFPVVFVPYFILKKQWRAAVAVVVFLVVVFALTIPVFGGDGQTRFWEVVLPKQLAGTDFGDNKNNNSLYGTFDYSTYQAESPWYAPAGAGHAEFQNYVLRYIHLVGTGVAFVALAWVLWRCRDRHARLDYLLDYALILLFVLLFAKGVRTAYNLWTIPAIVYFFSGRWSWRRVPLVLGALAVLLTTQFWRLLPVAVADVWGPLRITNVGLVALFVALLWVRGRKPLQ